MACKLTRILFPPSLIQALLTVLSQVLCFLAVEWYLPLLVSSLVLGWLNLLYYTRGLQHTGIYSVMIQKVREGLLWPQQAGAPLQTVEENTSVSAFASQTQTLAECKPEHERAHTGPQRAALCAGVSKHKNVCVC